MADENEQRSMRLLSLIQRDFGGSKKKFRAATGIQIQALWNITHAPRWLHSRTARDICDKLNLPKDYFDNDIPDGYIISASAKEGTIPSGKYVSLIGELREKNGDYVSLIENTDAEQDVKLIAITNDDTAYCLQVVGDHLRPRYRSGQNLLLSPKSLPMPSDDVLVKLVNGDTLIKEFFWSQNGTTSLGSLKENTRPTTYRNDQIEYMHPIKSVVQLPEG